MTIYRLPNGELTDDYVLFENEWGSITTPVESLLDVTVASFGKKKLFVVDNESHRKCELPVWMARKIADIIYTGAEDTVN